MHSFLVSYCGDMCPSLPVRHQSTVPAPQRRRAWDGHNCGARRATSAPRRNHSGPPSLLVWPLPCMAPPSACPTAIKPKCACRGIRSRQAACSQEHGERRTFKGVTQPLRIVKNHLTPSGTPQLPSGLTTSVTACAQSHPCSTSRTAKKRPPSSEWFDQSRTGRTGGVACVRSEVPSGAAAT